MVVLPLYNKAMTDPLLNIINQETKITTHTEGITTDITQNMIHMLPNIEEENLELTKTKKTQCQIENPAAL
jgi:hypothetical protein